MPNKKTKSKKKPQKDKDVKVRELELKENMEEYGKVISLFGDRRITVKLPDGSETLGCIPKRFKRQKCFIKLDDVVIVSIRDFQENKVDVIYQYNNDEVTKLIQYGEIPDSFGKSALFNEVDNEDYGIIFEDNEEQKEDEIDFDEI